MVDEIAGFPNIVVGEDEGESGWGEGFLAEPVEDPLVGHCVQLLHMLII